MENTYEMMYMSRMCDRYAQKALFNSCSGIIQRELYKMIETYPFCGGYKEDMKQLARECVLFCIECYREDKQCSFTTFTNLVIHRRLLNYVNRIYRADRPDQRVSGLLQAEEPSEEYGWYQSDRSLEDPEYYFEFQMAYQRLKDCVSVMNDMEKNILQCWISGISYKEAARQTGLTLRSYEGRLLRLKKKVKQAVFAD